ncbi:hypothetical protein [Lacibacter sp. H407]|uniref:hypothetical protein n=1 Tax=Lacibacter sp. H407 TaxID=3133423 RepID=UPI0030C327B7
MSQTSSYIKLRKQRKTPIKTVINYCLIALLAFSFSWQQFSAFITIQGPRTASASGFHAQHSTATAPQFSSHFPFESAPIGQEMEMEVLEEDETKNSHDEYCTAFVQTYSSDEILYTSSLKSRFLQLATSIHNRSTVPFFILHHSWKSYLS